jgi:hypothetical protein
MYDFVQDPQRRNLSAMITVMDEAAKNVTDVGKSRETPLPWRSADAFVFDRPRTGA